MKLPCRGNPAQIEAIAKAKSKSCEDSPRAHVCSDSSSPPSQIHRPRATLRVHATAHGPLYPFLTTALSGPAPAISVPLVARLLDGQKDFRPDDLPPLTGEELRPLLRPRLTLAADQRTATPRSPRMAAMCTAPPSTLR